MAEYTSLSIDALLVEYTALQKELFARVNDEIPKLESRLDEFQSLVGGYKKSTPPPPVETAKARSPAPPKYQHPEHPGQTWTGRGKQPGWFKALLESGVAEESLRPPVIRFEEVRPF